MRTKALLGLAALAASATIAMAQTSNVYSLNVVGYVNVTIPTGYSILGNPLDAGNNSVSNLFNVAVNGGAGPATGATVLTFGASGFTTDANDQFSGNWDNAALVLAPGTGFFFKNPGAPFTNTFVGTVPQGALSASLPVGYSLKSALTPVSGNLQTAIGVTNANPGDSVYLYSNGFVPAVKDQFDGTWSIQPGTPFSVDVNNGPVINIGTGFFYKNNGAAALPWTLNFTVQ